MAPWVHPWHDEVRQPDDDGTPELRPSPESHTTEGDPSRVFRRILKPMTNSAAPRRHLPTSPFKARAEAPLKRFAVGDRVTHDRYGLGQAIAVEGDSDIAVLVDFGSRQERITQPYAAMFKL